MAIKYIVQARENSQRFSKKCFAKINEVYAIDYLINSIKKSKYYEEGNLYFVIPKEDKGLIAHLKKEKIFNDEDRDLWFAFANIGDKNDILVRITADSPLLPTAEIDYNLSKVVSGQYDYASNELTMFGKACEAFRYETLLQFPPENDEDRQHVTIAMRKKCIKKFIPSLMLDYFESEKYINNYVNGVLCE